MNKKHLIKSNSPILNANNRTTKLNGQVYLIRSQGLGSMVLADAEPIPQGGMPINLFARTVLAKSLRNNVENGIFS